MNNTQQQPGTTQTGGTGSQQGQQNDQRPNQGQQQEQQKQPGQQPGQQQKEAPRPETDPQKRNDPSDPGLNQEKDHRGDVEKSKETTSENNPKKEEDGRETIDPSRPDRKIGDDPAETDRKTPKMQ